MLTTRVPQRGSPRGTRSPIGIQLALCYGFTESVRVSLTSKPYWLLMTFWIDSWRWEDYSQVRFYRAGCIHIAVSLTLSRQLRDHPGNQGHGQHRIGFPGLFLLRFQGQSKAGPARFII